MCAWIFGGPAPPSVPESPDISVAPVGDLGFSAFFLTLLFLISDQAGYVLGNVQNIKAFARKQPSSWDLPRTHFLSGGPVFFRIAFTCTESDMT